MDIGMTERPAFAVIGKEGEGDASAGAQWVPALWQDANAHFGEIAGLVKREKDGAPAGVWGAMSDVLMRFEPWSGRGKYLAGCEAADGAEPPQGWAKWVIPAHRYLTVGCTQQTYGAVFGEIIGNYLPQNGWRLAGAVQEFYPPREGEDAVVLYFPVERVSTGGQQVS